MKVFKGNSIKYKCTSSCNKDYLIKTDEEFKKRFKNTFKYSNNNINKFMLCVYPYEYMDDWE